MRRLAFAAALLLTAPAAGAQVAQSFTAPTTPAGFAPFLTRLAAAGLNSGTGLDLFAFDGTQFVGPALFSQTLILGAGFQVFPNVALLPGQVYILSFRNSSFIATDAAGDGRFPGGALQICNAGAACVARDTDASGFAADFSTVAVPSTVPEPATWALVGAGLAGLAGVARRRSA